MGLNALTVSASAFSNGPLSMTVNRFSHKNAPHESDLTSGRQRSRSDCTFCAV